MIAAKRRPNSFASARTFGWTRPPQFPPAGSSDTNGPGCADRAGAVFLCAHLDIRKSRQGFPRRLVRCVAFAWRFDCDEPRSNVTKACLAVGAALQRGAVCVTNVSGQRSPIVIKCEWRRCRSSQCCCPRRTCGSELAKTLPRYRKDGMIEWANSALLTGVEYGSPKTRIISSGERP
jgi:hypothetical protein